MSIQQKWKQRLKLKLNSLVKCEDFSSCLLSFAIFFLFWFLLTYFNVSILDILASRFLDFLFIDNILHTTSVTPILTPEYWVFRIEFLLSLSPLFFSLCLPPQVTTSYPHLCPHMSSSASATFAFHWKPCYFTSQQEQKEDNFLKLHNPFCSPISSEPTPSVFSSLSMLLTK